MISSQKILNINQFCASSIYTLWLKYNLVWNLLGSHKIYLDPTRSTKISPDLLGSQKIYWDLTSITEIPQDLQRSHKKYRDLTRYTEISQDLLIWPDLTWHLTFDIWHLTLVIWHLSFDNNIWHLKTNCKTFVFFKNLWNLQIMTHSVTEQNKSKGCQRIWKFSQVKYALIKWHFR